MIKKDKDIVKEIEQQIYPATDEEYKNIADELKNMSYNIFLKKTFKFIIISKHFSTPAIVFNGQQIF